MAAEYASIRVELVEDYVPKILEQLGPSWMVRQDARMEHVRIAEDELGTRANCPPCVLGGVAVVGEDAYLVSARRLQRFAHRLELGELILRQRFRRKQIQGATRWILKHRVEHGRVVAERF